MEMGIDSVGESWPVVDRLVFGMDGVEVVGVMVVVVK